MSKQTSLSIFVRVRVVAAVIISYFAVLAPLPLFGWEGLWWTQILVIGSAPLLAIAVLTAFIFAGSIRARPVLWALAAGLTATAASMVALWFLTGTMVGAVALPFAAFAPIVFVFVLRAIDAMFPAGNSPAS